MQCLKRHNAWTIRDATIAYASANWLTAKANFSEINLKSTLATQENRYLK